MSSSPSLQRLVVRGVPVSPGLAVGTAFFHEEGDVDVPVRSIGAGEVAAEKRRLQTALSRAKRQLKDVQERIESEVGAKDAAIFGVQSLLVDDPAFRKGLRRRIQEDLVNAEVAIRDEVAAWETRLSNLGIAGGDRDPIADLRDIGRRVLRILTRRPDGRRTTPGALDGEGRILVTQELLPSDTAHLDRSMLAGIVTASGGTASHAAILARGLGIPAVTGVDTARLPARGGCWIVDGTAGHVVVNPTQADIDRARQRTADWRATREALEADTAQATVTADGTPIGLWLNVENWATVPPSAFLNLRGVGLYRTEFLYMNRPGFPSEEEQVRHYEHVLDRAGDGPVTFRTIDVGGDKPLPYLKTPHEPNPVLGWRGLRLSLEWPDLLYPQVSALLRAGARAPGRVRILLPMVTMVEEFRRAREIVDQICTDLSGRGVPFDPDVQLGAMIEIPAAALAARELAREADFLSIGTNDLSQYALAVDRNNASVSSLYQPLHPGLLRIIKNVAEVGEDTGTHVSVCGEMAGDPEAVLLLLGMGLTELSMAHYHLPIVRTIISAITIKRAHDLVSEVLDLGSTTEIRARVRQELRDLLPELAEWLVPSTDPDEADAS